MLHVGPFKLETKIGNVWITATQADHVYIDFGHNLNVEKEGPENNDRRGPVTVRGVVYSGSAHLFRYQDGTWNLGSEYRCKRVGSGYSDELKNDYERSRDLYLHRPLGSGKANVEPSAQARRTVTETILDAFRAWALSHQEVFNLAEETHRDHERETRLGRVAELRAEIAKLEAEIADLSKGGF